MTIETLLIIIGFCVFACYLVYKWQEAAVDFADPPYQEPVKETPVAKEEIQAVWPFPVGGNRP